MRRQDSRPRSLSWALVAAALLVLGACDRGPAESPPAGDDGAGGAPGEDPGGAGPAEGDQPGQGGESEPSAGGTDEDPGGDGVADGPNACGGVLPLDASPGWTCGPGDQGRWVCAGPNALVCDVPQSLTVCHYERGSQPTALTVNRRELPAHLEHGDYYGLCQPDVVWVFDDDAAVAPVPATDGVVVVEDVYRYHRNACGGTAVLPGRLGDSCGRDGLGTYECDGPNDLVCIERSHVTLCHVPPGNPGNAHTITVGASAVDAHLGHGDYLGGCRRSHHDDDDHRERGHRGRGRRGRH